MFGFVFFSATLFDPPTQHFVRLALTLLNKTPNSLISAKMPPMSLTGMVTSVGKMSKTATVTVTRLTQHPRTRKVRFSLMEEVV